MWFRNNCHGTNLASCLVSSGDVAASLTRKLNSSFAAMMLHAAKDYLSPYFTTAVPSISCKYNEWDLSHLFLYAVDMSAQAAVYSFNCFQKGIIYLPEGSPLFTSVLSTHHARVVFRLKCGALDSLSCAVQSAGLMAVTSAIALPFLNLIWQPEQQAVTYQTDRWSRNSINEQLCARPESIGEMR